MNDEPSVARSFNLKCFDAAGAVVSHRDSNVGSRVTAHDSGAFAETEKCKTFIRLFFFALP